MSVSGALKFLRNDNDKVHQQFVGGKQFMSILQREGKDLQALMDIFDPKPDDAAWVAEYNRPNPDGAKLELYRKRLTFLHASRKEFKEEYDPEVTDGDFMRLLEVPFTDSNYVLDWSVMEMG